MSQKQFQGNKYMRLHNFFFILLFLVSSLTAQDKELEAAEELFYSFTEAYFERDLTKMKSFCLFNEDMEILDDQPAYTKAKLVELKKTLRATPVKWHTVGEVIKINNAPIRVNEIMVNDRKKIGTIRMLEMVYPLILRKSRASNTWKIDPTFMIQSVKKHLKTEMKRNARDFRIVFDGKTFHLNEGEKIIVEDLKGVSHRVTLYRNEIQHYKDGRVKFHYHKDMEVFPNKMKGGFVYTLTSELGPELHLLIYDKGADLQQVAEKYINVWIENYEVNDAQFEKKQLKEARQEINGEMVDGKVLYVRQGGKVLYNQFYFFESETGTVVGVFAKCKAVDTGLLNKYLKIACEDLKPLARGTKR